MSRWSLTRIRNLRRWARRTLRSVGHGWARVTAGIREIRRTATWCAAARFWRILVWIAEFYSVVHFTVAMLGNWPV
ncbi:hypothetical protein ACFXOS_26085 [Streptomyces sp. NPDC059175]|uniref:hypothetical protein n=1 Tax=Streptomyces sp. NPDC059175 TaxID=3346757 RepID=UPI0036C79F95